MTRRFEEWWDLLEVVEYDWVVDRAEYASKVLFRRSKDRRPSAQICEIRAPAAGMNERRHEGDLAATSATLPLWSARRGPGTIPAMRDEVLRHDTPPREGRYAAFSSSPSGRLPAAVLLEMQFFMRLSREWDLRFEKLARQGAVGKWYSSVGNEATTVAAASALEPGDALLTLHRDTGAILRYYTDPGEIAPGLVPGGRPAARRGRSQERVYRLACQLLGKRDGFSGGYERSYHYSFLERDQGVFHVGMISHLGAMIPVAAGIALAFRKEGNDRVALNFIGDGGTSTGDFHEALNMAAVLRAPLILVVENNQYAFSTPVRQQYAAKSLASRGAGYGVPGVAVDGNDPEAVWQAVSEAVLRARLGEGPTLIEAVLGRMRGHSEGDRSIDVVPSGERERYFRADPLERFESSLTERQVAGREHLDAVQDVCARVVLETVDRALAAADPHPTPAERAVLCPVAPFVPRRAHAPPLGDVTYLEAISAALAEAMREDPQVFLMGQDIAEFGGAFTVTRGFLEEFGAERVINTPIAESGTVGVATGAAILGCRPVVEMQFADFVSCAFNQIVNVTAKLFYRTGEPVPLVVRLPSGGGVGAGPFHSQCVEAWFLHAAGLKVVAPAWPHDAYALLLEAIRDPNPVLYIEHKYLYRRLRGPLVDPEGAPPGGGVAGRARVVRAGDAVTIVTYGWMVHRALESAQELEREGVSAEVIDLRVLSPLDEETVLQSVRKTGRVLVVHEAPLTGGFGGELAARIAEKAFDHLDAPPRRLAYPDTPVPYNQILEKASLPDPEGIARAARRLVAW